MAEEFSSAIFFQVILKISRVSPGASVSLVPYFIKRPA
jgi:hypothetical protein